MSKIADSNITKRALANALKEVMEEKPFEKISISDICERCEMNRKSFYYHFKDKYDLVNWIFDTECLMIAKFNQYERRIDLMLELCQYFYENRRFYRSALQVRGQNSFLDHFHELARMMVIVRLEDVMEQQQIQKLPDFCVNFVADGFTCTMVRWIEDKNPIPPEQFVESLVILIKSITFYAHDTIRQRQAEGMDI